MTTEPKDSSGFVTRRPVAITMLVVAMAVFGYVSLSKLPMDLLPEISYPTLTVRTNWEGAAPEDIETRISERLQENLATLPKLVRTSSTSRAGVSDVVLDFDWGTEMTFAVQDVRLSIDSVFLPRGSDRPLILRYDPNLDPIIRIGIATPAAIANSGTPESRLIALRWLAEKKIKQELENLDGVAAVEIHGGLEEEIRVRLDPGRLAALKIPLSAVEARLAAENLNASGGSLLEGSTEYLVRTQNEFRTVDDIADLSIADFDGARVRIRDLGEVTQSHKKREVITTIGGAESVEIAVFREAGSNIIEVADRVKTQLFGTEQQRGSREGDGQQQSWSDRQNNDYIQKRLAKEATITTLSDQSVFIRGAVNDVKEAALLGALFAILVIWAFLRRLSATVVIATAIPISVIVTFAPMFMSGVSLNIMSLGGLALGIGMLVDNSIVVLESISRCREEGDSLERAAVRGTREVAGAVTASTLTTVAVFAPIAFVSGIAGQIFGDQAVAVVASLSVSLLVAVMFIPMLASRSWLMGDGPLAARATGTPLRVFAGLNWTLGSFVGDLFMLIGRLILKAVELLVRLLAIVFGLLFKLGRLVLWPVTRLLDVFLRTLEEVYLLVLRASLAVAPLVVIAAGLAFYSAWQKLPDLGTELLPEIHQGEFTAFISLPVGAPLELTRDAMQELDGELRAMYSEIETTALTVGVEAETLTRRIEGPNTARLAVRLVDGVSSQREDELLDAVRQQLLAHPATESVEIQRPTPFALDAPISVEVRGHDLDAIGAAGMEVYERLRNQPGISDVSINLRPGHPEALVHFDREKTAEFGLDLATVSTLVRNNLLGTIATRFSQGDERIDVRLQADEESLRTLEDVLSLVVNPESATPVPLRAVASMELVQGPAEIRRVDNTRAVVISVEAGGLDLGGLTRTIEAALSDFEEPPGVKVVLGGQKRELDETQDSMRFALLLAIFLVYVVMAAQFESLLQPFIILLTVPLAGIGVIYVLDWTGTPLSVVVFIGVIMLAGIVVNNAIVLIDRINQRRRAGMNVKEAVLEAGRARLRPILMTTATTALGLLPMTGWLGGLPIVGQLGSGEGAELRAPMAIAVIAGLLSSTVLTLVVIPTVYRMLSFGRGPLQDASSNEAAA